MMDAQSEDYPAPQCLGNLFLPSEMVSGCLYTLQVLIVDT